MTCRYQLTLAGPVPRSVAEVIGDRFGEVRIRSQAGRTVLDGLIADQAAVRALLVLVWDAGGEVRLLRVTAGRGDVPGTART